MKIALVALLLLSCDRAKADEPLVVGVKLPSIKIWIGISKKTTVRLRPFVHTKLELRQHRIAASNCADANNTSTPHLVQRVGCVLVLVTIDLGAELVSTQKEHRKKACKVTGSCHLNPREPTPNANDNGIVRKDVSVKLRKAA